ncbi:hypothetical protein MVLG_03103 [Microbotryum lychnidis-dioicae p1A1 Lamole]|uniref:C3H1-type domain-containing protein n=1 Tax=Microbotryum lychnidis-dioicae (strain p1A1 Lamole / MvSl-1064) TaxID=683840 RepID=U5H764_USTV1|nr:hypothetical protein MVLG_03103 [Microbotryum lychnidis-dioicae p1A1 Lamole]|eukprot:KDE06607.1 hypothetical protein MVLG_03103 [Microbotryum lychnidis-dioicae p1A1 Lamole]
MPPKKQKDAGPAKVKPDLTFGMKNKKGGKGQQKVALLQQQAAQKGRTEEAKEKDRQKAAMAARKAADAQKKDELANLFTPIDIVQPKVPFGVDPKTVLCAFHKAGRCQKGTKCKFSHDLNQDRKQQKASIYADQRDENKETDTMDKWNDEKLQQVVSKKGNPLATTDIVCKHFIDAVETGRYGWFWECPDGGDACKYRHALPPGFVLKSQRKKEEEDSKRKEITLEDFIEVERHKLDQSKLTPITKESFAEWKKNRVSKKEAEAELVRAAKSTTFAQGKATGMSGRDLFSFNPDLGMDSEDEEEEGEEEDWDITLLRIRREREDRLEEMERIRRMGGDFEQMDIKEENENGDAAKEHEKAET